MPLDVWPGAPVYSLGNNVFLVDNSEAVASGGKGLAGGGEGMVAMDDSNPLVPPDDGGGDGGSGGSGATYTPLLYTNAPEELLFDTTSSSSNGVLASWRDVRTSPAPTGMALGILIATNCPFTITQISAIVILDDPGSLVNTGFEVGFFRNTNDFALGMYEDPEYLSSDVFGGLSKTLTDLGDGTWLLNVQVPIYGWGTNRVLTIRTAPVNDGTMTHLSFVGCGDAIPGVTAYASDNTTTNMLQVALPKMQVWRSMIAPTQSPYFAPPPYETVGMDMDVIYLPGYQLGSSTNLNEPMDWETDPLRVWSTTVDSSQGMQFFITRPDPTQ